MKKILLAVFAVIVFLSGCANQDSNLSGNGTVAINILQVQELLKNQQVSLSSRQYSSEDVSKELVSLSAECRAALSPNQYTVVFAKGVGIDLKVFVDEKGEVICSSQNEPEHAGCQSAAECDDGLLSTVDSCDESGKCFSVRTTDCKTGDNFCPQGCFRKTDSDCLAECLQFSDCDDSDRTTADACVGIIKKCTNQKILSEGIEAVACESDSDCSSDNVCRIASCGPDGLCRLENQKNGYYKASFGEPVCGKSRECFGGECVDSLENPLWILSSVFEWEKQNTVKITVKASKLASSVLKYGRSQTGLKAINGESISVEPVFLVDDLLPGLEYFFQVILSDQQGLSSVQTQLVKIKNCLPCNDSDACTLDSCDFDSGICLHEPDASKTGCQTQ